MTTSGNQKQKPVIGVVGGIGAGKSTVAAELAALGCSHVNADELAHEVLADEQVRQFVRKRWGGEVFDEDGSICRPKLAGAVFGSADGTAELNALLHPRIRKLAEGQIARAQRDPLVKAIVLDAALLIEAGWDEMCTHLLFVDAPQAVRRERSCRRHGWDEREWSMREKSQFSLDRKASKCDYTVNNGSTVSCLREEVRSVFDRIMHAADRPL